MVYKRTEKQRAASRDHYYSRGGKERQKAHVARMIVLLWEYKQRNGCEICGYAEHPAALHFDHRDPETKSFNVGAYVTCKLKKLIPEMRKCRVLCANCHAIETVTARREGRIEMKPRGVKRVPATAITKGDQIDVEIKHQSAA